MKGGKAAPKSVKKSGATVSKGKGKGKPNSSEDDFHFLLHEVCSDGKVVVHHSNHDLLRECEGSVNDSIDRDVLERLVAALDEEDDDKDLKKRDECEGCGVFMYRTAVLLDFMTVFGTKVQVSTVVHHSDVEDKPFKVWGETVNAATLFEFDVMLCVNVLVFL